MNELQEDWQDDDDFPVDKPPSTIDFRKVIDALLDVNAPVPPRFLYRLSDLEGQDFRLLEKNWFKIPAWRRQALLEDLLMLCEKDFLLSFEAVGRIGLVDVEPKVRFAAVSTLYENECEAVDLVDIFIDLMENDPDPNVRAVSTHALGHFVYMAEIGSVPIRLKRKLEDHLLTTIQGEDKLEVRCIALESLGYSGRDEVTPLIENAMNSPEIPWKVSSLMAMGRSANEYWNPQVINSLCETQPILRAEAARAAGQLSIHAAKPHLFDLVEDADENVSVAALWALSQIGGKGVRKLLQARLHAAEDDEEISFIENALDNLELVEGGDDLSLQAIEEMVWNESYRRQAGKDEVDDESDEDDLIREDYSDGLYDDDDLDEDSFDSLLDKE